MVSWACGEGLGTVSNETVNQTQSSRFVLSVPVCYWTQLSLLMKSGQSGCDTIQALTDKFLDMEKATMKSTKVDQHRVTVNGNWVPSLG